MRGSTSESSDLTPILPGLDPVMRVNMMSVLNAISGRLIGMADCSVLRHSLPYCH